MLKRTLPLFLIVVMFLSACAAPQPPAAAPAAQPAQGQQQAAAPAPAGGTVKIGLEAPLTGDYAEEGKGFQNALQLLVDQTNTAGGINGQKVQLFIEDDQGDPKQASLVADRLISDKVVAVIGGYNSSATEPASAIYNREGILQITPASTATRLSTKGYQNFFRVCFLDDRQGLFAANFLVKDLGAKKIAILHDNSTFAQGLAESTKASLKDLGVEPVFYDAINPRDTDFSATLTKLKAANPDVVYFTGYYAQGGLLLKQAAALGMKTQWTGGNAMNNPELIKIAGLDNAKGFIATTEPLPNDLDTPEAKQFIADYKAKYGIVPQSVWTTMAADAYRVIKYTMEQTKSTDPKVLADYLHNTFQTMPGITGPILGFDKNGDRKGTIHKAYVINDQGQYVPWQKQ
jgi:branched-chain amino acid transport system substrate-binding protein